MNKPSEALTARDAAKSSSRQLQPTPEALRKLFRDSYDAAMACGKDAMRSLQEGKERALECGWTALRVKRTLPHGEFLKWLESSGPDVNVRVVQRWMTLGEHYAPKLLGSDGSSNTTGRSYLPPLTKNHLTLFLQLTDGKSQNAIEQDIGARTSIKVNKVKRNGASELTPEQQLQHDLLMHRQGVESGFAFCFKHAGELKDEDRNRLAWSAYDALFHLLPVGKFQWKGPRKKARDLETIITQQVGGRAK